MGIIRGLAAQPTDRLIGSVWEMRRSTKPTARPDGSALGVGDILILTTDNTRWRWNGAYWVGVSVPYVLNQQSSGGTTIVFGSAFDRTYDLWVERIVWDRTYTSYSASEYFTVAASLGSAQQGSVQQVGSTLVQNSSIGYQIQSVQQQFSPAAISTGLASGFRFDVTKFGTAGGQLFWRMTIYAAPVLI